MRLLLDTHAFIWWSTDDERLGRKAHHAIENPTNAVHVSAVSAWEIALKRSLGRLDARENLVEWIAGSGFAELPIEIGHAVASADLPWHHRDPFDRMLIAQAQLERLTLVTRDTQIAKYDLVTMDAGL